MNKTKLAAVAAASMIGLSALLAPASATANTYWWGVTSHELTADERELVERVVAAEARGTSIECMIAVAQTIRERAEHWGLTVTEVVTARAQYAKPYKGDISDEVKEAVIAVFDDGKRAFDAYTTHFHTDDVNPWWNKAKTKRGEIDDVLFWGADIVKE